MIRLALLLAALALCGGCAPTPAIDADLVCSVTSSGAYSRLAEGGEAWDWPVAARSLVERTSWTDADEKLIKGCGSGGLPPAVRVAFSPDRKLAIITRSSFETSGVPGPDSGLEQGGAIESCLLRREKVLTSEQWQPVGCKLDAVS